MRARATVLAVVAGMAAAGLAVTPAAAAPDLEWSECAPELNAPRGTGCATIDVPLDYEDSSGEQITLTLSAAGSLDAPEALVVNPGGPGESGIGTPKQIWSSLPPEVSSQYLVVGFDPRGVGASSPVDCGDTSGIFPTPLPPHEPADADQEQQRVDIARQAAEACAENSGDLLPHITTANAARDLDRIRSALAQDKLDYLGYSYGTKLGATYATLFPDTTGRMVLDSVVDPTVSVYESGFQQNNAMQKRAEQFFDWIAERDDQYHLGVTGSRVQRAWDEMADKLEAQPAEGKVGSAALGEMLASTMYSDTSWPTLAGAVSKYRDGDASGLVSATEELGLDTVNGSQLAYNCVDGVWPTEWQTWHDDTARSAGTAPLFAWLNTWYSASCAFWGAPPQERVEIGEGDVPPVMLVQAQDDPATPAIGAHRMQETLPGSRLVLAEGGNHGQFLFETNDCIDTPVLEYLRTGELPSADVDCPVAPAPGAN
ncbi:alpha/beta hydrolase [Prauserella cavernicola]|uniref:Alpha/beta fold hydrolase n=1 Tax=Prauserella cavernicola TaxID=2800127 RepID=A0A934QWD9_9PSEU|nr:alpha/beta hydrolase [Prauserella cavernicola]MBK1787653.1 alpha/beta fold hydrolase [Prauserella cavernicola]